MFSCDFVWQEKGNVSLNKFPQCFYMIVFGIGAIFISSVSSQDILDISIASRNCYNVTLNVFANAVGIGISYNWILYVDGKDFLLAGTELSLSYQVTTIPNNDSPYSSQYSLQYSRSQLSDKNLFYNATFTFQFSVNDTANYQVGLQKINLGVNVIEFSSHFKKPRCQHNGRQLLCKDQSCFCDTDVIEICPNDVNVTHQCLYSSEDLKSSNATLNGKCDEVVCNTSLLAFNNIKPLNKSIFIASVHEIVTFQCENMQGYTGNNVEYFCSNNGSWLHRTSPANCTQESASLSSSSTSYWWIYVLVGGSGLVVIGGGAVIMKRKFKNKRQKSTIYNEEAKSLQETEA